MSSHEEPTHRSQFKNVHPGQALMPSELEPGQDIAVLRVIPPSSVAIRALHGLARALNADLVHGADARGQLATAAEGWNTGRVVGSRTLWRGQILEVSDRDVVAVLTHGRFGIDFSQACSPEELPLLPEAEEHAMTRTTHVAMGLAPTSDGRWLEYATVRL